MSDARHPLDPDLDRLFAAYREACDDVSASPQFMPNLWARIDARHDALQPMVRRLTQFFLPQEPAPLSYVEVLAKSHSTETVTFQDVGYIDALRSADPDLEATSETPQR